MQTGLWKQPGRYSSRRGPVLLRSTTGQRQIPAWPLPLASLAQTFLASRGTAPMKGQVAGVCTDMPRLLPRLSPTRAFPLGLGLS